ncbi:hypothetical protein K458DRAFT_304443 [Lentithecium fluviatile CBS 122367]|uniref:1-alkyl-2-acetylglycerophosphocholine esterase n=1 Tax=Lentithecium fluviatile CBS 122367 TaxID=1168545 RepID=A0A6G1J0X3_9PLEO|nr:hypothetical protein K458DRAFT_304443 [Lentithecium fluviatile CBS 122367]
MYAAALIGGVAALIILLPEGAHGIAIPAPAPHGKSFTVAHARSSFVDSSRKDPYNDSEDRKLAYSLFLPVNKNECTKQCSNAYMPDLTAKKTNAQFFGDENAKIFEQFTFDSCCASSNDINAGAFPVVVFEPAVGTSRLLYNQLARQVSAVGTTVVLIDHPYDASIVEFDGLTAINGTVDLDAFEVSKNWDDTLNKALDTRKADIESVIKELGTTNYLSRLFPDLKFSSALNTNTFDVMGHGLGGSAATVLSTHGSRVGLSINLSGSIPVIQQNSNNYLVFFGREAYTREDDANWRDSIQHFQGRFVEWDFTGAGQMDYTDLPRLVDLVNSPNSSPKGLGANGVWAFHCTSCFLEGYIRDVKQGGRREVSDCYVMCPNMEPYAS